MKCKFIKKDETQCRANAIKSSGWCFMHHPDLAKERNLATLRGGLAPKKFLLGNNDDIVIETPKDAKKFLGMVIQGVWNGQLPASPVANTLGFLVRCFLDAHEASEVQEKLEAIEQRLQKAGL